MVRFLIQHGANGNIECVDEGTWCTTPLGATVVDEQRDIAVLLHDSGAKLYPTRAERGQYGEKHYLSPMELAAREKKIEMLKLFTQLYDHKSDKTS